MKQRTGLPLCLALLAGIAALGAILVATARTEAVALGEDTGSTFASAASTSDPGAYAEGVIDIFLGDTITVSGEGASVDGSTVNITAAGVYRISGVLADGRIDVDAKGKVYLEFDGVDITSCAGPALTVTDAKKVTITLVDGTINSLADTPADVENDAALFTNDTLIINGSGTLIVTGNNNEGISSDDDIIINSGTINVTAADDGLNAHDDITVNGGSLCVVAGGDGLDSNGTININGGTVVSLGGADSGNGGLDANGLVTITGGCVVAGGDTVTAPCDDSSQASIYVATGSIQPGGTAVTVTRDGEEILTFTLDEESQNILVSSSRLMSGATYQVYLSSSAAAISVTAAAAPDIAGALESSTGGQP